MSVLKSATKLPRRVRQLRKAARIAQKTVLVGTGLGVGLTAVSYAARRARRIDLLGKVVVITGGSRGLGLALAEECAAQGANVAICARDRGELDAAQQQIQRKFGVEVLAEVCDVTNNDDVEEFLTAVLSRFGQIDVLINNAGIISVGPLESQTLTEYQEAMDVMYWGVVYPTLTLLPHMKARRSGRIANVASIGGKISVPHLVPYSAAKFAAVGFSEGLRSELLKDGIKVTTICPGLMRTGSHLNAFFKGKHRSEFTWFSFGATMPLVSIDAHRAARKIIDAVRHGDPELIITPQAKLGIWLHGLFPGITTNALGIMNRLLPNSDTSDRHERYSGHESENRLTRSFLQHFGRKAAHELNQTPANKLTRDETDRRWQSDVSA
ncbi:MAG TPA: SDR family NAD(P)-dependent oxidoreductase [Terriglobales bacterium]|nr:SDR family NAD(P)-dependent oxidoreductase [Terriglobales bacterium]